MLAGLPDPDARLAQRGPLRPRRLARPLPWQHRFLQWRALAVLGLAPLRTPCSAVEQLSELPPACPALLVLERLSALCALGHSSKRSLWPTAV